MIPAIIGIICLFCWSHLVLALSSEEWQSGSPKCSPCYCSITRPTSLGGSLVKYVNCSNIFVDQVPPDLPDDTEFLDFSRRPIRSIKSHDVHYNGSSLMYPNLPKELINATDRLHKLKYLDLTGNSFNEFQSSPFLHLEFLSGIFGLEVHRVTAQSLNGLQNLGSLELRTPMESLPEDLFSYLRTSKLTLHLERAPTLPSSIFDPLNTSLKKLIIFGDKMVELPESLLDNLLLLQKFTLIAKDMERIPEHLLHGSTLFRSLNLKQDIPDEMWMLLHSMSSTRYLKDITIEGVRHLPKNIFQYIPYLETIAIHKTQDLDPSLFKRLVRLNNLKLADNNIKDVKKEWFKDLGGLRTLNLSNNEIMETTAEDFENLHSLEVFDLSGNGLENVQRSVFDSFRSAIEELHLNGNNFGSLENDVFSEMWSLQELHLDNNNISEIESPLFRDLHKLDTLTLNDNRIDRIEEGSFDGLQELRNLDLSNNNVETLPDRLFSNAISLQSVNISQNNLESVSSGMLSSHFWLKDLDVGTNPLHCDCALARMVDTHKQSMIAGKCSSPPKYEGVEIRNLPTSAMCTEEELRKQEEEERRQRAEELRRKQEEIRRKEEELRKKTTAAPSQLLTTLLPTSTATPSISTTSLSNSSSVNTEPDVTNEGNTAEGNQPTLQPNKVKNEFPKGIDIDEDEDHHADNDSQNKVSDKAPNFKDDDNNNDPETPEINNDKQNKINTEDKVKDFITQSRSPEQDNNNISNDINENKEEKDKTKSNVTMNSQRSRKQAWSRTPWAIAVIFLLCVLLVVGSVLAAVKARGYLYRDNYNFNFGREYIIDPEEDTIPY